MQMAESVLLTPTPRSPATPKNSHASVKLSSELSEPDRMLDNAQPPHGQGLTQGMSLRHALAVGFGYPGQPQGGMRGQQLQHTHQKYDISHMGFGEAGNHDSWSREKVVVAPPLMQLNPSLDKALSPSPIGASNGHGPISALKPASTVQNLFGGDGNVEVGYGSGSSYMYGNSASGNSAERNIVSYSDVGLSTNFTSLDAGSVAHLQVKFTLSPLTMLVNQISSQYNGGGQHQHQQLAQSHNMMSLTLTPEDSLSLDMDTEQETSSGGDIGGGIVGGLALSRDSFSPIFHVENMLTYGNRANSMDHRMLQTFSCPDSDLAFESNNSSYGYLRYQYDNGALDGSTDESFSLGSWGGNGSFSH